MLAMLAHDLRAPLGAARGALELLATRSVSRLDQDGLECLDLAQGSLSGMERLLEDLLAYARAGAEGQPMQRVDLQEVAADVVRRLGVPAGVVTWRGLPVVDGQPLLLRQLLQNLLANALAYHGAAPPRIHVSAVREAHGWRLDVEDNGRGMTRAELRQLFTPFQRAARPGDPAGHGLGSAICRRIAAAHGGRIWAESIPGEGTTFHVTLQDAAQPKA